MAEPERIRVRGDFWTRYYVQWARGLWYFVCDLPNWLDGGLRSAFETLDQDDRRRNCPHRPEWLRRYTYDYVRCEACGQHMGGE